MPLGNEAVEIANWVLLIVIVRAFVAVADILSFTWKVMEVVLAVVGVPEMTPLELNANPAGNVPEATAQVYGAVPLVAVRVCE